MKKPTQKSKFLGVDLHTNRFTVFYITSSERYSQDFELTDLPEFLKTVDKNTFLGVEASSNTFSFVDRVRPFVADIMVLNTFKLKLISMTDKKTDKVDAEKIAKFIKTHHLGGEELIEPVYVPDENIRTLRSLFATYKMLKRQITVSKNRIHALFKQELVLIKASELNSQAGKKRLRSMDLPLKMRIQLPILLDQLDSIEKAVNLIENEIYKLGADHSSIIDRLVSIKGISPFTALAIIADIGKIERFKNAKKFSSYLRSTPGIDSSNETTRIKKTSKQGRKLSIELIIQAVTHFRNFHPELGAWYDQKVEKKSRGKLRMAIARKVLTQVYHVWRDGEYHWHKDDKNHQMKMRAFNRILAKNETLEEKEKISKCA